MPRRIATARKPPPRRDRGRRIRRLACAQALGGAGAGHDRRPAELPPVRAAAVSGRDRRAVAGRYRAADPAHPRALPQYRRRPRHRDRHRHGGAARCGSPTARASLRQARGRDRLGLFLFRPSGMGGVRAGAAHARGCAPHPRAAADGVRARRGVARSRRAGRADDDRDRRRRADRRGNGGLGRRAGASCAGARFPHRSIRAAPGSS